ncbi:zinc finger, domain containing protein [Acanthamoeba castellanii str. Neff]|uniref:Zinc finger, domain containing protein n=1 Tax=Acanthamoeba castellanii (strain ATCC 30010 / Neff) TaxID=1257118 RepID=L8H7D5_ACACF|nr:zinc finger, domain containing protein [Acanthamoeba castellanii str. Neff]ELR20613.1 zinc finger, domain containing protein [Acanthamoeba castellanii str. Neff]
MEEDTDRLDSEDQGAAPGQKQGQGGEHNEDERRVMEEEEDCADKSADQPQDEAVDGAAAEDSVAGAEEEDGEEGEEEEDVEESEHRPPILDGRNIIFKTRLLSGFLVCQLCMGVLRDAHTIRECLHTFCKSCLYKYFQTTADCPLCGVDLRPNPFERIRFDRTVQTIVNKIFSDLIEKDIAKEAHFYRSRGMIQEAERVEGILLKTQESKAPRTAEVARPANKRLKRDPSKPIYKDEVAFELTLDEGEPGLQQLEKPVIRTSARVTVRHLKKFVGMKLAIPNLHDLEITYRGEVLGTEHSLEYILKTRGYEGGAIEFKYRKRKNIM